MTEAAAFSPPPAPQPIPVYVTNPGVPGPIPKDPTAAVLLEILPALCMQTFGIGNIYAGNVLVGIAIMVAYWISCLVNALLCVVLIGFVTWPLTWLAFAAGSSYLAYHKAKSTRPQTA
jgi:TM2 domain-containing membrane protein YozV